MSRKFRSSADEENVLESDTIFYWDIKNEKLVKVTSDTFESSVCDFCVPSYNVTHSKMKSCHKYLETFDLLKIHLLKLETRVRRCLVWTTQSEIPSNLERVREVGDLRVMENVDVLKIVFETCTLVDYRSQLVRYFNRKGCPCRNGQQCTAKCFSTQQMVFGHLSHLERKFGRYMVFEGSIANIPKDGSSVVSANVSVEDSKTDRLLANDQKNVQKALKSKAKLVEIPIRSTENIKKKVAETSVKSANRQSRTRLNFKSTESASPDQSADQQLMVECDVTSLWPVFNNIQTSTSSHNLSLSLGTLFGPEKGDNNPRSITTDQSYLERTLSVIPTIPQRSSIDNSFINKPLIESIFKPEKSSTLSTSELQKRLNDLVDETIFPSDYSNAEEVIILDSSDEQANREETSDVEMNSELFVEEHTPISQYQAGQVVNQSLNSDKVMDEPDEIIVIETQRKDQFNDFNSTGDCRLDEMTDDECFNEANEQIEFTFSDGIKIIETIVRNSGESDSQ